ncbi:hypothetical protein EVAR_26736_1 [Eumeta japonica]|uniref:Uncharacterized protein n=1 Tax=Eumeta variegata TaxID=151549 RepID=A0A4C1XCZ8_EUMVA|nr:hypothetical protein EVAR_26736_1 [Eumeta japonica]
MDLIDGAVVGMSNGWTDWDEIFYVYSNGFLDDFKTKLNPVGGTAVGSMVCRVRARVRIRQSGGDTDRYEPPHKGVTKDRERNLFIPLSKGKGVCEVAEHRRSPLPMDIRDFEEVTSALLTSCVEI